MTEAPTREWSRLHVVDPVAPNLHGHFSRDLPPILTIQPGDRVRFRTLDVAWGAIDHDQPFEPAPEVPRDRERDPGHALCGPIAIEGAKPGMTLEVRLIVVRTGRWGWTAAGGAPRVFYERMCVADAPRHVVRWALDPQQAIATNQAGDTVRMKPFPGILGMPPDEPGRHPTMPPRASGGNIDCRELVEGSALFLPIPVAGGLFSAGDGHAAQGDGEVAGPALECPLDRLELGFHLHDYSIAMPRARTPAGWITFGFHESLDEAMWVALSGMLDLMEERHGLDRREALALASLTVSLRVTQIVNGIMGVHAILPHGAARRFAAR
jgi:acetamidase/formamidase